MRFSTFLRLDSAVADFGVRQPNTTPHTKPIMTTLEKFQMLEQMCRDNRSLQDIHTAIARYREMEEAIEESNANNPKPMPKAKIDWGGPPITGMI